jgi:two-component system, OmpR family, alkaline phosphatase synthesis response regulator PhoP
MSRILIIEDDVSMALGLEYNLRTEGYETVVCRDGESGLKSLGEQSFDLVLLDWMLPGLDGIEVLKHIRAKQLAVPVLLLTARDGKEDMVEGLDAGADDYIAKPFDLNILLARLRSLLRSRTWLAQKSEPGEEVRFGKNRIRFDTFEAEADGKTFKLSYKEAMIMKLFLEKRGQVITREELLQKVWGINGYFQSRTIDNHVVQLRKYFEENPKNPRMILSIHGEGYKFVG